MSAELNILRLFCENRELCTSHLAYTKTIESYEREIKILFLLVEHYYQKYDSKSISKDELISFFDLNYPGSKDRQLFVDIIDSIFKLEVNNELMKEFLDQLIERHYSTNIINALMPVMEGVKFGVLSNIRTKVDEFTNLLIHPPNELLTPEPCIMTVPELVEREIMDEGIPWHLPTLNRVIGGIRINTLGLIYAYVESGKTSFAMKAMAKQSEYLSDTDEIIAYAGNEEKAPRLLLRYIQALLGLTRLQIVASMHEAQEVAKERGLDRVRIFDEIISGEQIEYILETYKPLILYVDQATDVDIKLKRRTEGVEYLKQLFKWYRRLANKYDCAIVGVSQGVGEAGDKMYLELKDIYGSRVPIQGALDYAIGIGRLSCIEKPEEEDRRYINIPKNKLHDGGSGKCRCLFQRETSQWKEV